MNIGVDIDGVLTNIQDYVFEYGSKFSYEKEKDLSNLEKNKYETAEIFNCNMMKNKNFGRNFLRNMQNMKDQDFLQVKF